MSDTTATIVPVELGDRSRDPNTRTAMRQLTCSSLVHDVSGAGMAALYIIIRTSGPISALQTARFGGSIRNDVAALRPRPRALR